MNWKDLNIGFKIGSGFLIIVIGAAIIGMVAFLNMNKIQKDTNRLAEEYIPVINETFIVSQTWMDITRLMQAYDYSADEYFINKSKDKFKRYKNALKNLITISAQSVSLNANNKDYVNIMTLSDEFEKILTSYEEITKEVTVERKKIDKAFSVYLENKNDLSGSVISRMNEISALIFNAISNEKPSVLENLESKAESLSREVSGRNSSTYTAISDFADAAQKFTKSFTESKLLELKRHEITSNIYWEIKASSDIGLDKVLATGDSTNATIRAQRVVLLIAIILVLVLALILLYVITNAISKPILASIEIANNIAEGNLTQSITSDRKDEVGKLADSLNKVNSNLRSIVTHLTQYSQNISDQSQKLLNSADDIADGSKSQASAAEEISSSMEEMYANIQQNTENAKETQKIAEASASEVNKSKESFKYATDSLKDITDKIIIINDIAFQTNILALNAAIEAARAGEHGRGFAVVAGEVKKLADKSKVAAGTINEVSSATMIMSKSARRELEALVPEIEKTANLINEITAANMEQSSSVEHINNAMQQLNVVIQNNAQRSDELAQHSKELSVQAEELQNLVSEFQL